jgi:hypothetical protein
MFYFQERGGGKKFLVINILNYLSNKPTTSKIGPQV